MYFLDYDKSHKEFSRFLRNNSTLSEVLLWNELRAGKMYGFKFNRQKPLGNYIVDFYCKKLSLVIEVDGWSHETEEAYIKDSERQKILESMRLKFLRFDDLDIKFDISNVLRTIEDFVLELDAESASCGSKSPNPLEKRGNPSELNFHIDRNYQMDTNDS